MRASGSHRVHSLIVLLGVVTAGCSDRAVEQGSTEIAVTNSYLECVVRDLCGRDVSVLCLAPPGMCPGHFDISPTQVRQLQGCRILLLFDFQQQIESRLARLREAGLRTSLIRIPPSLCVPDTYMIACEQVAQVLSRHDPQRADEFARRLSAIRQRLERLGDELHEAVQQSEAASAKVLSSNHQARFVEWLGLEPVATFVGSDIETVANIDHCLKQAAGEDVRFVVANRQEGTALAEALARRLGARSVVFSNFPQVVDATGFDRLIRNNVNALLEAGTR